MKALKITTRELDRLYRERENARLIRNVDPTRFEEIDARIREIEAAMREAVEAYLEERNGRAHAHVVTSFDELKRIAREAERILDEKGVPQALRVGTIAKWTPAMPPRSYKYNVRIGVPTLQRTSDGWRLISYNLREERPNGKDEAITLMVSEEARDAIVKNALKGIIVKE